MKIGNIVLTSLIALTGVAGAGSAAPPPASSAAPASGGKAVFADKCAMCHGAKGMGTDLLGRRVQPAMLEQRHDLVAEYIVQVARHGIGNMPAIPRGEVSDAQLAAIAAYLASNKAPQT